jgi:hypothetical protein
MYDRFAGECAFIKLFRVLLTCVIGISLWCGCDTYISWYVSCKYTYINAVVDVDCSGLLSSF